MRANKPRNIETDGYYYIQINIEMHSNHILNLRRILKFIW